LETNGSSKDKSKKADYSFRLTINGDAVWDGLKGIVTNNMTISDQELIRQYGNLWQTE